MPTILDEPPKLASSPVVIRATKPVTVPEITYDLWGLERFELAVRGQTLDTSAILRRCSERGWSGLPEHTVYLRESDLVKRLVEIGDPAALAALQQVQDGLLLIAGVLLDAEGKR